MSGMAEVLAAHELAIDYPEYFACTCGTIQDTANGQHYEHVAAMLTAAGFGPVKEAAAKAWGEGHEHYGNFFSPSFPEFGVNPYRTADPSKP